MLPVDGWYPCALLKKLGILFVGWGDEVAVELATSVLPALFVALRLLPPLFVGGKGGEYFSIVVQVSFACRLYLIHKELLAISQRYKQIHKVLQIP